MPANYRVNRSLFISLAAAGGLLLGPTSLLAQLAEWTGTTSSDWQSAANWSPAAVPVAGDDVIIDTMVPNATVLGIVSTPVLGQILIGQNAAGELEITAGAALNSGEARIGDSAGSSGQVSINTGSGWNVDGSLDVGRFGTGSLEVIGGSGVTVFADSSVGFGAGSSGDISISGGSGLTVSGAGQIRLGVEGSGTMTVGTGSGVNSHDFRLGVTSTGEGLLRLDGGALFVDPAAILSVGVSGEGTIEILPGGFLSSGSGHIGSEAGGQGLVRVLSSTAGWTSGGLSVGLQSAGELRIEDGASVIGTSSALGVGPDSYGEVLITGSGSSWSLSSSLIIGSDGEGFLQIADGGSLISELGRLGGSSGGRGEVSLVDAGSNWSVVGTLNVGRPGEGSLEVGSGSTVTVGDNLWVGDLAGSNGRLSLAGGVVSAGIGVVVDATGTLEGAGEVNGWVRILDDGVFSPGFMLDPGSFDISGFLDIRPGARLAFSLGTPGVVGAGENDLITVGGNLILDGTLDIDDLAGFGDGIYTLITYDGNLTDNGLSLGTVPAGHVLAVDTSVDGEVRLLVGEGFGVEMPEYVPIPVFDSFGLLVLVLLLILLGARRLLRREAH